jgi:tetrahydromethanopterin S-methyltransferase subunit C
MDGQGTPNGPNIIGVSKSAISESLGGGVPAMGFITLTAEEVAAVYQYITTLP